ncbi:MAG: hypothetical protein ACRBCT_01085 [Alphaproteobacteria bacterium]
MGFRNFQICFCLVGVLALGACQQTTGRAPVSYGSKVYKQDRSENSTLYSKTTTPAPDINDPLAAHMLARKQVDPKHVSKRNAYVHYEDEYPELAGAKNFTNTYTPPPVLPPIKPSRGLSVAPIQQYSGGGASIPVPDSKPARADKISYSALVATTQANALTVQPMAVRELGAAIRDVRIGDHPGKTRIVVDVTNQVKFDAWLQDDNHVLVMRVPDSRVETELGKVLQNHSLVKAYGFRKKGNEQQFIVTLKRAADLTYKAILKPNATYRNYRIVLDLNS